VREIAVLPAWLRGQSVHERASLRVEIVPRLSQVLEAEPIQQPEHALAQRQAMQALADGVRNFLPLRVHTGRRLFGCGGEFAQKLLLILAPALILAERLHGRDRKNDLRDRFGAHERVVQEQDDVGDTFRRRHGCLDDRVEITQEWVGRGVDDPRRVHGEDARVRVIREHVEAVDVVAHVGALLARARL